jgi:hypothetical protein
MNNGKTFRGTGITIALLNLLAILNGANYFLFQAKFPVFAWLVFNICAPSVTLYLIGFFYRQTRNNGSIIAFSGIFRDRWTFCFRLDGIRNHLTNRAHTYDSGCNMNYYKADKRKEMKITVGRFYNRHCCFNNT